jgi:hypothetical protein
MSGEEFSETGYDFRHSKPSPSIQSLFRANSRRMSAGGRTSPAMLSFGAVLGTDAEHEFVVRGTPVAVALATRAQVNPLHRKGKGRFAFFLPTQGGTSAKRGGS